MTLDPGGIERGRRREAGHSGGCTDVGPVRAGNEDHLLLDAELGLFVVADGMGGHQAGEVASHLAVDHRGRATSRAAHADGVTWPFGSSADSIDANRLTRRVRLANARVYAAGAADPAL